MQYEQAAPPEVQTLLTGLGFGESPRWHEDRLWFSNWGMQEIVAGHLCGQTEGFLRMPSLPCGIAFPNGMTVTPDNSTLIVAESYGKRLTAFDIAADGNLSHRRVWADLGGGVPDGICIDAENAVWFGDVPNKRCSRVREGGEVL